MKYLISELENIKASAVSFSTRKPQEYFSCYLAVDRYNPTISDLPDGKKLIKTISVIVFNESGQIRG